MLTVENVINSVGSAKIKSVYQKTQNRYVGEAIEKYITEKLSVAHYLNLHNTKNKKLLDIGTGVGWFPFICKQYGHYCLGTDIEGREDYDPVYDLFGIKIKEVLVFANEKININEKFDYVVSLRSFIGSRPITFNLDNWKFFLKDIDTKINDSGGLYLGCNKINGRGLYKELESTQVSHWGDKKLGQIFAPYIVEPSKEKKIKPNTIYIPKEKIKEVIEQI